MRYSRESGGHLEPEYANQVVDLLSRLNQAGLAALRIEDFEREDFWDGDKYLRTLFGVDVDTASYFDSIVSKQLGLQNPYQMDRSGLSEIDLGILNSLATQSVYRNYPDPEELGKFREVLEDTVLNGVSIFDSPFDFVLDDQGEILWGLKAQATQYVSIGGDGMVWLNKQQSRSLTEWMTELPSIAKWAYSKIRYWHMRGSLASVGPKSEALDIEQEVLSKLLRLAVEEKITEWLSSQNHEISVALIRHGSKNSASEKELCLCVDDKGSVLITDITTVVASGNTVQRQSYNHQVVAARNFLSSESSGRFRSDNFSSRLIKEVVTWLTGNNLEILRNLDSQQRANVAERIRVIPDSTIDQINQLLNDLVNLEITSQGEFQRPYFGSIFLREAIYAD